MSNLLTADVFKKVLPKQVRSKVDNDMIVSINGLLQEQDLRENFRDNLLSYTGIMKDGKFRLKDYINAVRFVSYRLLGSNNQDSYAKTFPERFQRLIDSGADAKTISSYSTAYGKTQLVVRITEQTMIPTHIVNQDIYQKAINIQAVMMSDDDVSPAVRQKAADSLLTHLKTPETIKMELDIGVKQDKAIDALVETTRTLAEQQRDMIKNQNVTAQQIAHSSLVIEDGEVV